MTPDPDPLDPDGPPDVRWCADVAAALEDASARAGTLAAALADDWPDVHGQEWADRTTLLHRELDRASAEAAGLARQLAGPATDDAPEALLRAAVSGVAAVLTRRSPAAAGPRLGDTTGTSADSDLGMRIAELPPH